jgi:hypothetical protein
MVLILIFFDGMKMSLSKGTMKNNDMHRWLFDRCNCVTKKHGYYTTTTTKPLIPNKLG